MVMVLVLFEVNSEGVVKVTSRKRRGLLWGPLGVEEASRTVEEQCTCRGIVEEESS